MTLPAYTSSDEWFGHGELASYIRVRKSAGGALEMVETASPARDISRPAVPDLILHQALQGGVRARGDSGGGVFDAMSEKGIFYLDAPNFSVSVKVHAFHRMRSLAFPAAQWQSLFEEASVAGGSVDDLRLFRGPFQTPVLHSALRKLWAISEEEGGTSRLLARAAGCEILAELSRLSGAPFAQSSGGLAPWAERRCRELMHTRLSEDISLDELASEARLSPFHFARMFKQSVGVPPRVYLTQLRMQKACELLEHTDLPITEIALEVGYSSNQVLARVFTKQVNMSPSDYRRAMRDPTRTPSVYN
jgi:AraC family transcriptional regulator